MANNCAFDMKITGKKAAVDELIAMLSWKGAYKNNGLGRVFSCEVWEYDETSVPGIYEAVCFGDCAWSIKSSMRDDGYRERTLEGESERLGLVVEAFSSEPGIGFQEHLLIVNGDVTIDDCVDYEEHGVLYFGGVERYNQEMGTNFTEDMINEDGDVCIGGFENYGEFEDASVRFAPEKVKSSLNIIIAESKAEAEKKAGDNRADTLAAKEDKYI